MMKKDMYLKKVLSWTRYGWTPLSQAAKLGRECYLKKVLSWILKRSRYHTLQKGGHEAVMKLLVERGADLECSNVYGRTPLHITGYLLGARGSGEAAG
jgi:hypothetical protein